MVERMNDRVGQWLNATEEALVTQSLVDGMVKAIRLHALVEVAKTMKIVVSSYFPFVHVFGFGAVHFFGYI